MRMQYQDDRRVRARTLLRRCTALALAHIFHQVTPARISHQVTVAHQYHQVTLVRISH